MLGNLIVDSGRAALQYDDRNRDGFVHGGWAHAATDTPGEGHWKRLAAIPYQGEPWLSRYPLLQMIKTSFETDPDDIDFPINPSYSQMKPRVGIPKVAGLRLTVPCLQNIPRLRQFPTRKSAGGSKTA